MSGKLKTMNLVEDAELDRLNQRPINEYNPGLNSFTKIQDQIFKIFDDYELSDERKRKIIDKFESDLAFY